MNQGKFAHGFLNFSNVINNTINCEGKKNKHKYTFTFSDVCFAQFEINERWPIMYIENVNKYDLSFQLKIVHHSMTS